MTAIHEELEGDVLETAGDEGEAVAALDVDGFGETVQTAGTMLDAEPTALVGSDQGVIPLGV